MLDDSVFGELTKTSERGGSSEKVLEDLFFREMAQFPLLSPEEELTLLRKKKKDPRAKEVLILSNIRLVIHVARDYLGKYPPGTLSLLDLVQDGMIGLMKAIDKFDLKKAKGKKKLSTYATYWINQTIQRSIYKTARTVRIPEHLIKEAFSYEEIARKLRCEDASDPTPAEIATVAGVDESRVERLLHLVRLRTISITYVSDEDDDVEVALLPLQVEDEAFESCRQEDIRGCLRQATFRERLGVMLASASGDATIREYAALHDWSESYTRQLYQQGKVDVKAYIDSRWMELGDLIDI